MVDEGRSGKKNRGRDVYLKWLVLPPLSMLWVGKKHIIRSKEFHGQIKANYECAVMLRYVES